MNIQERKKALRGDQNRNKAVLGELILKKDQLEKEIEKLDIQISQIKEIIRYGSVQDSTYDQIAQDLTKKEE